MIIAGTFNSVMDAVHAAGHLRSCGVRAKVADNADPYRNSLIPIYVDEADAARARELLEQYEHERKSAVDVGSLDQAAEPDLTQLDPRHAPLCPACRKPLPIKDIPACPACGAPVDVPSLIADQFGPEVLAVCYETPRISPLTLEEAGLSCPGCNYHLLGLPPEGDCPECGLRYSKQKLLEEE